MPTKKGAGGRQQNYNSRTGRYEKVDYAKLYYRPPSRREKAQRRKEAKQEELYNRALKSKDQYLLDVFCEIEQVLPYHIQFVNEKKFDPFIGDDREFDIITRNCIIEIKGGVNASKKGKQFLAQKRYAESKNKQYIIYAPNFPTMARISFEKQGFKIANNVKTLINYIKDYEK